MNGKSKMKQHRGGEVNKKKQQNSLAKPLTLSICELYATTAILNIPTDIKVCIVCTTCAHSTALYTTGPYSGFFEMETFFVCSVHEAVRRAHIHARLFGVWV